MGQFHLAMEEYETQPGNVDERVEFFRRFWSAINQRFFPNDEITETKFPSLVSKLEQAFRQADLGNARVPDKRLLKAWWDQGSVPQTARLKDMLVAIFGERWSENEQARELLDLQAEINSNRHPRRAARSLHRQKHQGNAQSQRRIWRLERTDLLGGDVIRNSEPFAELRVHLPENTDECTTPIWVTMTQGVDEVDIDDDGAFRTFLVSLAGSRLAAEFECCDFEIGSRLGETSNRESKALNTGVEFMGGIWRLPSQSVHQRPLGDKPLLTLSYPVDGPCAFSLTLSCRNRQILVRLEEEPEREAASPLREKVIQAYVQKALSQREDGVVEVTKMKLSRE